MSARALLCLCVLCSLWGCAGGPPRVEAPPFGPDLRGPLDPQSPLGAVGAWFQGQGTDPASLEPHVNAADPAVAAIARLALAEALRQRGHMNAACAQYLELLRAHPAQPPARWAAARLWELRDNAAAWAALIEEAAPALDLASMSPATRAWWAQAALQARHRLHRANPDAAAPLEGDAHGFPQRWRMAGPFSIYPRQDRDLALPALDGAVALPARSAPDDAPWEAHEVLFDEPIGDPLFSRTGIYVLETWVELRGEQEWLLHLHSAADVQVQVDDLLVFDRDTRAFDSPQRLGAALALSEGPHRLRVRLAVEAGDERFFLQLIPRGDGALRSVAAAPAPGDARLADARAALPATEHFDAALAPEDTWAHPFLLWLRGVLALAEGDWDEALPTLAKAPEDSPAAQFTLGDALRDAPSYAETTRVDLAIGRYRAALSLDPQAGFVADRLAWHLAQQEQQGEALERLEALAQALPDEYLVHFHRSQLYQARGWPGEARKALTRALELYPDNCALIEAQWAEWIGQDRWPAREALGGPLLGCDITHEHLANHYDLPNGLVNDAIARYERLTARNPRSARYFQALSRLYDRAGRRDDATAAADRAGALTTTPVGMELQRYDGLLAYEPGRAGDWLRARLAQNQGSYDLRRALAQLEGRDVMDELRVDAMELVRQYRANPQETDSSGVYLLDYAATRVFEDGSGLTLTHNLIRVNNKEGIDRFGEVSIPGTALLLRLRTIKPDGRVLEPEPIAGKPAVSMPNLAPGDFIEFEYLEGAEGSAIRKGTWQGFRFFFHIFDAPLLRSEYVLELPAGWEPTLHLRNGAPEPTKTALDDGRQRLRFLAQRSPQAPQEPALPPAVEVLPSAMISHRYRWPDLHRTYRDRLLGNLRADAAMIALANELAREHKTTDARARAAFAWVLNKITDDESGAFAQPAAHTFHGGTGDRLAVLKVLLDLLQVESEFILGRSWANDQADSPIPEVDNWNWLLLRARIDGQDVWLDPGVNHAIYDFVPLALQGNRGVRLGALPPDALEGQRPDALFIDIPLLPAERDLRDITLALAIDPKGDLAGQGEERYTGSGATLLRRIVDSYTDPDELKEALGQSLGQSFPEAEIQSLTFENLKDPDAPLWMRYRFTAPAFARRDGDALLVERSLYANSLAPQFAALPERTWPLFVSEPVRLKQTVRLAFPEGFRVTQGPPPAQLDTPFGVFLRKEQPTDQGNALAWSQVLTLPVQRVSAASYGEFRDFAQRVDEAERLRLRAVAP
jgi:tetratricopeptide (TPR) repeat protein